jgi:DNA-binding transcriptional ArsR family regulator
MDVEGQVDSGAASIAAAIGEPARARMLYCLVDDHARTSTELAVVADVSASTASAHLKRLRLDRLVKVVKQGKHRYYSLHGPDVARVLEGLTVLAGAAHERFVPTTPNRLRAARTCYDHIAGSIGVSLHDRFMTLGWLAARSSSNDSYDVTSRGTRALRDMGIDVELTRIARRRFAFGCLDWSERRFHLAGAMGAALLKVALKRRWATQDLDSRALAVTEFGRREMLKHFGLHA